MAHILWSQDFFAKGELSPLMYSRVTLQAYYQGLKRAKNVICFPQGSAGKRFGTIFQFQVPGTIDYTQIYFKSFQYLNECCYLVVFNPGAIDIYLEGERIATVSSPIQGDEVKLIDHTILENRFRVTTGIYKPKDLTRSANAPNGITTIDATTNTVLVAAPVTLNGWWPARFTTTTSLPTTSPQIHLNKTYFVRAITTTKLRIYTTAEEAAADINYYTVTAAGVGGSVVILNTWTFADVTFRNLPQFDFSGGYDSSAFTPGAATGYGITITRTSGAFNFTSKFVGGAFRGNGGIARITAVNGTNTATVDIIQAFNSTAAIPGTQCLITEPAWSDIQGWPRKCSSFQNRAFFANTDTLSNGLWGSVTNDFDDFDDLQDADDDSAISWFPTSDTVNYIQFIVPYRSLTVHTNSGVYSTPLSIETVITPNNFSLSLQDSTPADSVQPQGIDNQIIVLSGNDAHSLLWDGFNNAYTSNIISVANEQLLRTPIDEAPYTDRVRAGSRYMFIVNADGTMAIYQSLIGENVSGFTDAEFEQSYGNAYFRGVTSNFDGRAWFLTERQFGIAQTPIVLTANSANTLTAVASNISTTPSTAVVFTAVTSLPTSSPQIELNTNYWAVGVTANTFKLYLSQADALADENAITFTNFGTTASVVRYPLSSFLFVEQLSFDVEMDACTIYPSPLQSGATNTIDGSIRFNAQEVLIQGDGFGFQAIGVNNLVTLEAHGEPQSVLVAQAGFPINVEITPLPISLSMTGNPKSSNLVDTKHLRYATFLFADTIGGTITQGDLTYPIALNTLSQANPGEPPTPQTGTFEISVLGGWDDFRNSSFTINHSEPFGMKLTGIFYKVDA